MTVIRGRVVAGESGIPQAGVRLYFASSPGPEPEIAVVTGGDGEFALTARHKGEYDVAAVDESGRTVSTKINLDSDDNLNLVIEMIDYQNKDPHT